MSIKRGDRFKCLPSRAANQLDASQVAPQVRTILFHRLARLGKGATEWIPSRDAPTKFGEETGSESCANTEAGSNTEPSACSEKRRCCADGKVTRCGRIRELVFEVNPSTSILLPV